MNHGSKPVIYPIPIYLVSSRYLIYDIDHVSDVRAQHRVPGVLSGTLPQAAQQNVFLGLPLELMNEEARFLVESGLAFVVDDALSHHYALTAMTRKQRKALIDQYSQVGQAKAEDVEAEAKARTRRAAPSPEERQRLAAEKEEKKRKKREAAAGAQELLAFDSAETSPGASSVNATSSSPLSGGALKQEGPSSQSLATINEVQALPIHHPTPATSVDLFAHDLPRTAHGSINVPMAPSARYALYKYLHMHAKQYFLSPGLRFGCHFLVYPGDPLRFHSHFLANGYCWDEQIPLMDLVGSGRLGTGVKKGFLVGAQRPAKSDGTDASTRNANEDDIMETQTDASMRCFSIEWAGM